MSPLPAGGDRGNAPGRTDSPEAEIARFQARLKADPASLAFLPLAEALRKGGKLDEAKAVCLQGLSHHPDYISGQVVLAKIHTDMNDRTAAREVLERVVESTPDHLLGNKLLAQNYLASGMKERARSRLGTVIMLNPADDEAAAALAALDRERLAPPAPVPAAPAAPSVAHAAAQLAEDVTGDLGEAASAEPAAPVASAAPWPSAAPVAEPAPPPPAESTVATSLPVDEAGAGAPDVEEVTVEGEAEGMTGPFMEFGDIDDVEEIVELAGEGRLEIPGAEAPVVAAPAVAEPEPVPGQARPPIELPELTEQVPTDQVEEITSETLADLYVSQDLPEKAIAIYRELLVEEPGNERIGMKLTRALAAQRAVAAAAAAAQAPREAPPAPKPPTAAAAVGGERTGLAIARLEEWLTTIGERRRGIH